MERKRGRRTVSVNKSESEHLQGGGPPLTGRAVCLAQPAEPGRPLGMMRFNAALPTRATRVAGLFITPLWQSERGQARVEGGDFQLH